MNSRHVSLLSSIAIAAALATAPALAEDAAPGKGVYIGGNLGAAWFGDADNSGSGINIESEYDTGYMASVAVGYKFDLGLRAEGEASYRRASLDKITSISVGNTNVNVGSGLDGDGDISALAFMANAAYDFKVHPKVIPFLIAGVGAARYDADDIQVQGADLVDDSSWEFAYQAGAGMGYAVTDQLIVEAQYRYFATTDPSLTTVSGDSFDTEMSSHTVMLGARYAF